MKKIVFLPVFLLMSLFIVKPLFAVNNINITCNQDRCLKNSDLPLFNESNIYPGLNFQSKLTVDNHRNESCNLKFSAHNKDSSISPLAEQIDFKIINGDDVWYTGSLYDLLIQNNGNLNRNLGNIDKNTQSQYQWSAVFNREAGNEYQNTTTNFDINFNFSCEDSSANNNPVSNGNSNPPVCDKSVPNAPTGFYTRRNSTGSVTLFWDHPTTPYTHYLVAYGTAPGVYLYGNPNVGNDDHYTVRDLTNGAQYCFYVRTINDCMPGGRTEEKCVNLGSVITPNTNPPPGFQPEVLGTVDENESTNPQILGAADEIDFDYWWLLLLIPIYMLIRRIFKKKK